MRKVKIYKPTELTDPGKHFQDLETSNAIFCAYKTQKKEHCSPNCAACEITQEPNSKTITCLRGHFILGEII